MQKTHPYLIEFFDAASSTLFPDPNALRSILTRALEDMREPFDLIYDWSSELERDFRNVWFIIESEPGLTHQGREPVRRLCTVFSVNLSFPKRSFVCTIKRFHFLPKQSIHLSMALLDYDPSCSYDSVYQVWQPPALLVLTIQSEPDLFYHDDVLHSEYQHGGESCVFSDTFRHLDSFVESDEILMSSDPYRPPSNT